MAGGYWDGSGEIQWWPGPGNRGCNGENLQGLFTDYT